MPFLLIAFVWLLNFVISGWNAYAVGKAWVEARAAGGWPRVMCWSGAVMSASGFTWCYLIFFALIAAYFQYIDDTVLTVSLNLGYVLLVPGILLSGLMITLDSWSRAFRQGGFLNYGAAIYNTYAQIHNTYSAITGFGDAFQSVSNFFSKGRSRRDGDRDGDGLILVLLLVGVALAAGVLTTTFIIWKTAATTPMPSPPTPQQFEDSARNVAKARRG